MKSVKQFVEEHLKEGFAEYITHADVEKIVKEYAEQLLDECISIPFAEYMRQLKEQYI